MKDSFEIESSVEKELDPKAESNRVFARMISRKLNKNETRQVSGGGSSKVVCYDTYIGTGMYFPDCNIN